VAGDTWVALAGTCPDGLRLDGVGRHRLRGLRGSQELYQLVGADLLADFPPPRTS
jgi:hypothetical protein